MVTHSRRMVAAERAARRVACGAGRENFRRRTVFARRQHAGEIAGGFLNVTRRDRPPFGLVGIDLARLGDLMEARQLTDMKTLVLVQALRPRHPALFA